MTCVVSFIDDNNKIWMGADSASASTTGETNECLFPKVFKKKGFLIGYTTSWRMGQLLTYSVNFPTIKPGQDLLEYMVTKFVLKVKKVFKDNDYQEGGFFLVGVRKRVFLIQNDWSVLEYSVPFKSVGCGSSIAKGAMFATSGVKDPEKRIIKALEAASYFSTGVRPPFKVMKL